MRLAIRADATLQMGTGHLMRCLALGQAWQDSGGTVDLVTSCQNEALTGRLRSEGFIVHLLSASPELKAFESIFRCASKVPLVLDGYQFDHEYQRSARAVFRPVVAVDDLGSLPMYYADLVLNQNIYAPELKYACQPYTRLLLGCKWVLLRREFRRRGQLPRTTPKIGRRLLVTLGGSDPDNVTAKVLRALAASHWADRLEAIVVVGAANPHLATLNALANSLRGAQVQAGVSDMSALMEWAEVAVIGGGSTCWETLFMGLPSIIISLADNQVPSAEALSSRGAAINLGWHRDLETGEITSAIDALLESRKCREKLAAAGCNLVDGQGAIEAVKAIRELCQ
jgi:UDP-2,4-diacetamido-2,4,6-trideoxy-beta-L-altropyranose hydrolase